MRTFFVLFFLCIPGIAQAAEEVAFLRPAISEVHRSTVCADDGSCHAVFIIKGRNFENANGVGAVKIGDDWAETIKWTPTSIVAITNQENLDRQPAVTVDTTLHRPQLQTVDPVINKMFEESVQVAIDSIRVAKDGTRYVTAGPFYGKPERVYYRDTYWTSGLILLMEPSVIRDQLLLLARGVEPNGSVPSAITVDPNDVKIPLWVDHYDSGSYLVMLARDYLAWTGDTSILTEEVNGRDLMTILEDVLTYLATSDQDGDLLIEKPTHKALNDWADSVPRSGEVLYDQVLYYKALHDLSDIAKLTKQGSHAKAFSRHATLVRFRINERMWNEEKGYYYERCDGDVCVDRLTNDSSIAALYDVLPTKHKARFLESLRNLETGYNPSLQYGLWGVSNVYPFYENTKAYFYQNGTDWPFLDGMNAGARLKAGDSHWYYPMTQWWVWWKASGRAGSLPEFVSQIDDDPGLSQAWSVNPIFSFVRYGLGFDPDLSGFYKLKTSPLGQIEVHDFYIRGKRVDTTIK